MSKKISRTVYPATPARSFNEWAGYVRDQVEMNRVVESARMTNHLAWCAALARQIMKDR